MIKNLTLPESFCPGVLPRTVLRCTTAPYWCRSKEAPICDKGTPAWQSALARTTSFIRIKKKIYLSYELTYIPIDSASQTCAVLAITSHATHGRSVKVFTHWLWNPKNKLLKEYNIMDLHPRRNMEVVSSSQNVKF